MNVLVSHPSRKEREKDGARSCAGHEKNNNRSFVSDALWSR